MPPVVPDPRRIKTFASESAFETWLASHHDTWTEIWIKVHKKDSGLRSITTQQALDVCLCWGWIDAIRKSLDDRSFLQRYTPRGPKSRWSQINRDHIARLTEAGRMKPPGQRQVDAAKADGRWAAAYAPMAGMTASSLPADLLAAIEANRRAKATFATLNRANLFSLAFRMNAIKTPAGRAKKIAALVEKLARGEMIAQSRPPRSAAPRQRRSRGSARQAPRPG